MQELLTEIGKCRVCEPFLEHGCRPVVSAAPQSKIIVIGQAPGRRVHESGIPWDDQSGKNLRSWLGVDNAQFYDPKLFGIVPMGFCYPGTGKSGDLPPRKECAPLWHPRLMEAFTDVKLVLLIGMYAQKAYLGKAAKPTLTATVTEWNTFLPKYLPLPHPSPRNNIWQRKNSWFEKLLLPQLKGIVKDVLEL